MSKKYFWLKLKDNFFQQKEIKKLRKIAGGDTYTIIYLKMQLLSLKDGGIIKFEGTEENLAEQLSYEIDEEKDNIQITINFLLKNTLIEEINGESFLLPKASECIGKEGESAERVRRFREKQRESGQNALQSNDEVTPICYFEQESNTEIEIRDRDKSKEIEIEISTINSTSCTKEQLKEIVAKWNTLNLQRIMSINSGTNRYKMLNARIKEYGFEIVMQALDNITKSSFLRGQNKKNWIISFDWFIKPNNFIKVLENNYVDKDVKTGGTTGCNGKNTGAGEIEIDVSRFSEEDGEWNGEDIDTGEY